MNFRPQVLTLIVALAAICGASLLLNHIEVATAAVSTLAVAMTKLVEAN